MEVICSHDLSIFMESIISPNTQHGKPESRQSYKGSLYTNMALQRSSDIRGNQQHGLRGNIKVKNKKKEVEKEIGKERKGKGKQRPFWRKQTQTLKEYAAMKKEQ